MERFGISRIAIFIALGAFMVLAVSAPAAPIDWTVRGVSSNGTPILNISDADMLLDGQIPSKTDATAQFSVINFNLPDDPVAQLFPGFSAFPGTSAGNEKDFAEQATGVVRIPAAGAYTFGVSSDDGFSLQVGTFNIAFPGRRAPGETYGTFNFIQPGNYPVNLVYFQHTVNAELELFASPGKYTLYGQAGSDFQLVGSAAVGALDLATSNVGSPVPEPSGIALLAPLALGLLWRPRRRSRD